MNWTSYWYFSKFYSAFTYACLLACMRCLMEYLWVLVRLGLLEVSAVFKNDKIFRKYWFCFIFLSSSGASQTTTAQFPSQTQNYGSPTQGSFLWIYAAPLAYGAKSERLYIILLCRIWDLRILSRKIEKRVFHFFKFLIKFVHLNQSSNNFC